MSSAFELSCSAAARHEWDVIVVGAGHNGLVAALVLLRAGLRVLLVEARSMLGGAVRTERPFLHAPDLPTSTGAYLLGLVQPELLHALGLSLPLVRRDPHYFLPTTDERYLLLGSDERATAEQFQRFFSRRDYEAHCALNRELAQLREDIAPTWLSEPLSIEETADRHVRPALQRAFIELCRGSVRTYLDRFGFESPLLVAMYAVTDGVSGLSGGVSSAGSGMNFLIHNMCRLPGSDGTWMLVRGGMGTISQTLADSVARAGGKVLLGAPVASIEAEGGAARAVVLESGERLRAGAVMAGCDPFTLRRLIGPAAFSSDFNLWLDARDRPGRTLKLNLALSGLPRFSCLPEDRGQFGPTIHLLPDEGSVLPELEAAFDAAQRGTLPDFPSIEWYIHGTLDRSLSDARGNLSSALFVQWVPHELAASSWEDEADDYADHLLSLCDRFAPGTSKLVVDRMVLHPQRIASHFGMYRGHIHHIDNSFGFSDRFPHKTPVAGLYSCSAGTHPGGSVIGSAGYIAARRLLSDLDLL